MSKQRADVLLVQQGLFESREQAKRSIMAGIVYELRSQERVDKPGTNYPDDMVFEVKGKKLPYVSRGGLKLKQAIDVFSIQLEGQIVLDIGASTGGFTDCCLQEGAAFVYALDVGTNQLAWKIRSNERVKSIENTNFRYAELELFDKGQPQVIVTDVSFISLTLIFDKVAGLFDNSSFHMVALIKPQFEAGREHIGKNGIIRDVKIHQQVIQKIESNIEQRGWKIHGIEDSPITGTKGNKEFLIYFEKQE